MALESPFPELDEFIEWIGEAGQRLSEIGASEGAAGNISIYIGWPVEVRRRFPIVETLVLPDPALVLAGKTLLVTGSGRRLRDIIHEPAANLGALVIAEDGRNAKLYTAPNKYFTRLTSELTSHIAVHCDQVAWTGTNFQALVHAQPPYLTYLSHIPRYHDEITLNRHLLRWQPELIVNLPEGVGMIPFLVPGSPALMKANIEELRSHRVVLWGKHGAMARSDLSVKRAADRIEYAETAARYEYMNLANGEMASGLSHEEIRQICQAFNIQQTIF
jgi:rhamnulose-1-phosphate aldolase